MSVDWTRFTGPGKLEATYRFTLTTSRTLHELAIRECHNDFARAGYELRTLRTKDRKDFIDTQLEARRVSTGKFHTVDNTIEWKPDAEPEPDDPDAVGAG